MHEDALVRSKPNIFAMGQSQNRGVESLGQYQKAGESLVLMETCDIQAEGQARMTWTSCWRAGTTMMT